MADLVSRIDMMLSMAETEYAALLEGDINTAERLCEERDVQLRKALEELAARPSEAARDRLSALQEVQLRLCQEAARRREDLRRQLFRTRQETRRMNAYHKTELISL